MKTLLIVFCALVAGSAFASAASKKAPPAFPPSASYARNTTVALDERRGPDCGVDRLSVIWGPDRQPGAYECYGRDANP